MRNAVSIQTNNSTSGPARRQSLLQRLFEPPPQPPSLPGARFWKIALRTAHIMATSVWVGGQLFGGPASVMRPCFAVAAVSGLGMILFEAYPSFSFLFEGWGLMMLAKLALLFAIPFAGRLRVPLILMVVALASVGSHMPRRMRHYSLLHKKVTR